MTVLMFDKTRQTYNTCLCTCTFVDNLVTLCSRGFLECLEQCGHDAVSIASCFVDMTDGFDIYTQYCTNYPR